MLCKEGKIANALLGLMKIMVQRGVNLDAVTYSSLVNGYCLRGEIDEAMKVFDMMVGSCETDVHSYNILINGCCKHER